MIKNSLDKIQILTFIIRILSILTAFFAGHVVGSNNNVIQPTIQIVEKMIETCINNPDEGFDSELEDNKNVNNY